eukprot:595712-Hanusia_phi.AAC.3
MPLLARWSPPKGCIKKQRIIIKMNEDQEEIPTKTMSVKSSRRRLLRDCLIGSCFFPAAAFAEKAGPKLPQSDWDEMLKSGKLTKAAYSVLHDAATERPFTSELLQEKRTGSYCCAAYAHHAQVTYESLSCVRLVTYVEGWPSFYDKLEGVELETGNYMDMLAMRTEVHCVKCGGHLGHVFDDGVIWEVPTGKR